MVGMKIYQKFEPVHDNMQPQLPNEMTLGPSQPLLRGTLYIQPAKAIVRLLCAACMDPESFVRGVQLRQAFLFWLMRRDRIAGGPVMAQL